MRPRTHINPDGALHFWQQARASAAATSDDIPDERSERTIKVRSRARMSQYEIAPARPAQVSPLRSIHLLLPSTPTSQQPCPRYLISSLRQQQQQADRRLSPLPTHPLYLILTRHFYHPGLPPHPTSARLVVQPGHQQSPPAAACPSPTQGQADLLRLLAPTRVRDGGQEGQSRAGRPPVEGQGDERCGLVWVYPLFPRSLCFLRLPSHSLSISSPSKADICSL